MRANRLLAVTVLSALGVSGLAACGSDGGKKNDSAAPAASSPAASAAASKAAGGGLESLSVDEILKKARAAGEKLTSSKITFKVKDTDGEISGALSADNAGNCSGTIGIEGKGKADLLRTGDKVWIKPDAQFIKVVAPNTPAASVIAGKWLVSDKADDAASFAEFCNLGLEVQKKVGLNDDGTPDGQETKGGTTKVGGVAAVLIKATDENGANIDVAIANEGEPYMLSMEGGAAGSVQFSDFNKPVKVTAPSADQVLDFKSLGGS